jgi:cysteine dioxygenase
MPPPRTIQDLVGGLEKIPAGSFTRERVLDEVGRAVLDLASMIPYCWFCPTHYTRNLIHRCELFEVLAIGWDIGQRSPIHNHRGQECWMGVPVGRLEVQTYRLLERDPVAKTCRLEPSGTGLIDPAHPAVVDPNEPIHAVANLREWGERAVSVHIYSRPYESCEVYLPDQGRYFDVPLDYTSRYGVLCPGELAEPAAHPSR